MFYEVKIHTKEIYVKVYFEKNAAPTKEEILETLLGFDSNEYKKAANLAKTLDLQEFRTNQVYTSFPIERGTFSIRKFHVIKLNGSP